MSGTVHNVSYQYQKISMKMCRSKLFHDCEKLLYVSFTHCSENALD